MRGAEKDRQQKLGPKIFHGSAVGGEILKSVEAIKLINREISDLFERQQSNIHCHTPPPVALQSETPPSEDACTCCAKQNLKSRVSFSNSGVTGRFPNDGDTLTLVIIRPKCTITMAKRTIAGRNRTRFSNQCPTGCAAVA